MVAPSHKINQKIEASSVRLIDEDGNQLGVVPLEDALATATGKGLDLMEVSSDGVISVCRIVDYGKLVYDKQKSRRLARKRQHSVTVKEIRFSPNIEEHDFQNKMRNIVKFLKHGDKVKVSVFFRGRQVANLEKGHDILRRVKEEAQDYGVLEKEPKLEGRFLTLFLMGSSKKESQKKEKKGAEND